MARVMLARFLESEDPTPAEAARIETFEEAARRLVKPHHAEGLATWKDRLHRLESFAFPELKRLDFHSFRRQFNTALAAIGLNVQQAMALAGRKSTTTHMAYVQLAQRGALETPSAALPD